MFDKVSTARIVGVVLGIVMASLVPPAVRPCAAVPMKRTRFRRTTISLFMLKASTINLAFFLGLAYQPVRGAGKPISMK